MFRIPFIGVAGTLLATCLTAMAGVAAEPVVVTDDFAEASKLDAWEVLEGVNKGGTATKAWDAGALVVGGALARAFPLGSASVSSCEGRVRFLFPAAPAQYDSFALILLGPDRDPAKRGSAMVIFKHPTAAGDAAIRCNGTLRAWAGKLKLGAWHVLKFDTSLGRMRMKVWPDADPEPAEWSLTAALPVGLTEIDAIGVRSYGSPVTCDDFAATGTPAPEPVRIGGEAEGWRAGIDAHGRLTAYEVFEDDAWVELPFRNDIYAGPGWFLRPADGSAPRSLIGSAVADAAEPTYEGSDGELVFRTTYRISDGALEAALTATNNGTAPFAPKSLGIHLGFDSYMATYPAWNDKLFPTTLRCEPTHHWGYAMSPNGRILSWVSPDPVASWNIDYNEGGISGAYGGKGGHRVYTASLHLLSEGPLPENHPRDLDRLAPGETRTWSLRFRPLASLDALKPTLSSMAAAPIVDADRYTIAPGETSRIRVFGPPVKSLTVTLPDGRTELLAASSAESGQTTRFEFSPTSPGLYRLAATTVSGKTAVGTIFVRKPWSWYLGQARLEGLRVKPTATHHAECVYPFYSYFLARKHLPDPAVDARCEAVFQDIFPRHYDAANKRLHTNWRIQDTATWIGILADRFDVTGDPADLTDAADLIDFLVDQKQGDDGGYYKGETLYTSVIYLAKSIMEAMREEEKLAASDEAWRARYDKHLASVCRAIDDLERKRDNIHTEGEQTYEDGMISCSTAQLAMFALKEKPVRPVAAYLEAALELDAGHRSLTYSEVPDARVNGATLRFWETQYTIHIFNNMLNTPCGWSAWKTYASYYLYLLTGEESHLDQAMNSLGACVQTLDIDTGRLRWGFTPEPRVEARRAVKAADYRTPDHEFELIDDVVGGEYLELVSDWNLGQDVSRVDKFGIDNFTHETFKCMEEMALEATFVIERADGSLSVYNGSAEIDASGTLRVRPADNFVRRIHLNLPGKRRVVARFASGETIDDTFDKGLHWVGPGGVPEDIRPFLRNPEPSSSDE